MLLTLQPLKNTIFKTYIVLIFNTEIVKGQRIYDKSKDQVIFNIAFSYKYKTQHREHQRCLIAVY